MLQIADYTQTDLSYPTEELLLCLDQRASSSWET